MKPPHVVKPKPVLTPEQEAEAAAAAAKHRAAVLECKAGLQRLLNEHGWVVFLPAWQEFASEGRAGVAVRG